MPKQCIYCRCDISNSNKSFEHAIPKWLLDLLGAGNSRISALGVSDKLVVTPVRHMAADSVGRNICRDCNNGWLSEIDSSCQDLVKFLSLERHAAKPSDTELLTEQAINLKTFLFKIAINFFSSSPFADKRPDLYESFYNSKRPPESTILFFSKYMGIGVVDLAYANDWYYWLGDESAVAQEDVEPPCIQGGSFKFYIKLGRSAYVIANSIDFPMVYDPNVLTPSGFDDKQFVTGTRSLTPCPKPHVGDSPPSRILFSLGYASRECKDCLWLSEMGDAAWPGG